MRVFVGVLSALYSGQMGGLDVLRRKAFRCLCLMSRLLNLHVIDGSLIVSCRCLVSEIWVMGYHWSLSRASKGVEKIIGEIPVSASMDDARS